MAFELGFSIKVPNESLYVLFLGCILLISEKLEKLKKQLKKDEEREVPEPLGIYRGDPYGQFHPSFIQITPKYGRQRGFYTKGCMDFWDFVDLL